MPTCTHRQLILLLQVVHEVTEEELHCGGFGNSQFFLILKVGQLNVSKYTLEVVRYLAWNKQVLRYFKRLIDVTEVRCEVRQAGGEGLSRDADVRLPDGHVLAEMTSSKVEIGETAH